MVIPVKILGFTAYGLWTFLARREANLLVYVLQPGVVPFSDGCFDSVGVSFRVGTTLPGC